MKFQNSKFFKELFKRTEPFFQKGSVLNLKYRISNIILFIVFTLIFLPQVVFGSDANNIYGIHLAQPHLEDLKKVKELVNSNGGDWGYVTLVIQENDKNKQKWQEIFDLLREYHLIPIIRLATKPEGENWKRPKIEEIPEWVNFLDSLNWVVKNRYIVLFNEPNHASEWGGVVDPEDYGKVAFAFAKALKEKNKNFFVMLSGFDASAPHAPPKYWDEELFLKEIIKSEIQNPKFETNYNYQNLSLKKCLEFRISCFEFLFDGWASHSYPNPNFSGSPYDWGRGTIRTYQWELQVLRNLGVSKDLPVFITETGWQRDIRYSILDIGKDKIAQNFKIAFEEVWGKDERVKAVTPFVFDYQAEPFLGFSWRRFQSPEFYPQYYLIQSLPKIKGKPQQEEKGEISFKLPNELVAESSYNFSLTLKNYGQAIWQEEDYQIETKFLKKPANLNLEIIFSNLNLIKPFEETDLNFFLKLGVTSLSDRSQDVTLKFVLEKEGNLVVESKPWQIKIIPPPSLKFEVITFPRIMAQNADNYEIQIFDKNEKLVYRKKPVSVKNKIGKIEGVNNVVLGERYRVVILRPYYLPRQTFVVFKKGINEAKFKTMLPLDLNLDGKFDLNDVMKFFKIFKRGINS
jgi:hypothetical protein